MPHQIRFIHVKLCDRYKKSGNFFFLVDLPKHHTAAMNFNLY